MSINRALRLIMLHTTGERNHPAKIPKDHLENLWE